MATTIEEAFDLLHGRQGLTVPQQETAATRVRSIGQFFDANYSMLYSVFPVGSYARDTMCARERDIDLMACLMGYDDNMLRLRFHDDSSAFLYWIRNRLNDHYHRTDVSSKRVCVKLDFTDIVTDVTPCFLNGDHGFEMPNGNGGWMATNPPFHTDFMANADAAKGGMLKPVVRLIKAWNIANGHRLTSFHVELMVEAAQRPYCIFDHPFEMAWTLRALSHKLAYEFPDPWVGGGQVGAYLSWEDRQAVIALMRADAYRADTARTLAKAGMIPEAFELWSRVFVGTFPAYG